MGRPRKPLERTEPTVGEAIEDVRSGLRKVQDVLAELSVRIEELRALNNNQHPDTG